MSEYAYCQRGGMEGIKVSNFELDVFADSIGTKALDEIIPLPNSTLEEQKESIKECQNSDSHSNDMEYWELENGSHGWCCSKCGTVIQWG